MMTTAFADWFHHHFVPEVKNNFRKLGKSPNTRAILMLDNCRAPPPESKLISVQIFATHLPPSVTSLVQPVDQSVTWNTKCHCRANFLRRLVNTDKSIIALYSSVTIKDAVYGIACARCQVNVETFRRCWRKLWPTLMFREQSSDAKDSFEGLSPSNDTPAPFAELVSIDWSASVQTPLSLLQESEIEEWVNIEEELPTAYEPTDEEIINCVASPSETTPGSPDDSEEVAEDVRVIWEEADDALKKLLSFA